MARAQKTKVFVALLRGINVGGHNKVPMAALRILCTDLGWCDVRTYIQSGNVIFTASGTTAGLGQLLAAAIEQQFGFAVPVIVRTGADWLRYANGSPFEAAENERANLLHLGLSTHAAPKSAPSSLEPYCKAGERIAVRGDALWVDFTGGVARSKLTSAVFDRIIGAPVTARNWKTVQAIAALVRGD